MFKLYDEFGTPYRYTPRSYDMACRVAYYLCKLVEWDIYVVDTSTKRRVSEVHYPDLRKDRYAQAVARRLAGE